MTEMTAPNRASRHLRPLFGRDPFTALRQEVDDLLSRLSVDGPENWFSGVITPSVDLSETNEALQVKIDVPGLKPEDIDIEVAHNSMRVSGERKEEKEEKGKSFHRVERRSGKFSRTISLPCAVQENKNPGRISRRRPQRSHAEGRRGQGASDQDRCQMKGVSTLEHRDASAGPVAPRTSGLSALGRPGLSSCMSAKKSIAG